MKANKRILIIYLLILCIGGLYVTGIFGNPGGGLPVAVVYTAKELARLAGVMNDAASAYYNIQQIVKDLDTDHKELKAAWESAENRFTGLWNAFLAESALYEQAKADMWAANDAWKDAERRRISAEGDINAANGRIAYCQHMLDAAHSSEMWEYWKKELKKAQEALRDAKSRKSQAILDKNKANRDYSDARRRMKIHKYNRDRWEKMADGARKVADDLEDAKDAKADELDVKLGEQVEKKKANKKAKKEYYAYKAGYDKQQAGGGVN